MTNVDARELLLLTVLKTLRDFKTSHLTETTDISEFPKFNFSGFWKSRCVLEQGTPNPTLLVGQRDIISKSVAFKRFGSLPTELIDSIRKNVHEFSNSEIFLSSDLKKSIKEMGSFRTFPIDRFINYINGIFVQLDIAAQFNVNGKSVENIRNYKNSTTDAIVTIIVDQDKVNYSLRQIVEEICNMCGYFIVYDSVTGSEFYHIQYYIWQIEPINQTDISVKLGRYLYHVTPANRAKKIKEQGLTFKKGVSICRVYPGRIYAFSEYNEELIKDYLRRSLKSNKTGKQTEDGLFEILTIDREVIPDITWFQDLQYRGEPAVYTYSFIPPKAMVNSKTIDIFSK